MAGKVIASLGMGGKMSTTAVDVRMFARVQSVETTATASYVALVDAGADPLTAGSGEILKIIINGSPDADDISIRRTDSYGTQEVETFQAGSTIPVGVRTGDTFEVKVK